MFDTRASIETSFFFTQKRIYGKKRTSRSLVFLSFVFLSFFPSELNCLDVFQRVDPVHFVGNCKALKPGEIILKIF